MLIVPSAAERRQQGTGLFVEKAQRPDAVVGLEGGVAVFTGEAVQVLLWKLAWEYRKLVEAKKLLLAGRKRFEVTSLLQITYFTEEFLRLVDRHELDELLEKHGEILKADVALKSSGGNEEPILDALVVRLAADRVGSR